MKTLTIPEWAFPVWANRFARLLIIGSLIVGLISTSSAGAQGGCWSDWCTITGQVTRAVSGAPIAGATVRAVTGIPPYQDVWDTTTDGTGHYSFNVIHQDMGYTVSTWANGYVFENYGTVFLNTSTTVVNIDLDAVGSVTGRVFQQDGVTPISAATIEVLAQGSGNSIQAIGTSAANGAYTTHAYLVQSFMGTEDYLVRAHAPNYEPEYYQNAPTTVAATPVHVAVNSTTNNINFTLARSGRILGHVYAADGVTPLANITVEAFAPNVDEPVSTALSAANGSYILNGSASSGFASGIYYVRARGAGYQHEYYLNAATLAAATPVHVATGADTNNINFSLLTAGGISGVVLQPSGAPFAGAHIFIYRGSYDWGTSLPILELVSQADGSFTSSAVLETDEYSVRYTAAGYLGEWYQNKQESWWLRTVIPVTSPAITPISITLRRISSIAGHFYKADGVTPMGGASVCSAPVNDPSYDYLTCAVVAGDGSYILQPLPGDIYYLWAEANFLNGFPVLREYYNEKPSLETADPFTLNGGDHVTGINFTLGWDYTLFFPLGLRP